MPGGSSFMEDYTYHLAPNNKAVLGAHMLDVIEPLHKMPKLPVASALWKTHPNLADGVAA